MGSKPVASQFRGYVKSLYDTRARLAIGYVVLVCEGIDDVSACGRCRRWQMEALIQQVHYYNQCTNQFRREREAKYQELAIAG